MSRLQVVEWNIVPRQFAARPECSPITIRPEFIRPNYGEWGGVKPRSRAMNFQHTAHLMMLIHSMFDDGDICWWNEYGLASPLKDERFKGIWPYDDIPGNQSDAIKDAAMLRWIKDPMLQILDWIQHGLRMPD